MPRWRVWTTPLERSRARNRATNSRAGRPFGTSVATAYDSFTAARFVPGVDPDPLQAAILADDEVSGEEMKSALLAVVQCARAEGLSASSTSSNPATATEPPTAIHWAAARRWRTASGPNATRSTSPRWSLSAAGRARRQQPARQPPVRSGPADSDRGRTRPLGAVFEPLPSARRAVPDIGGRGVEYGGHRGVAGERSDAIQVCSSAIQGARGRCPARDCFVRVRAVDRVAG
jgi:hypothetical protein